MKQNCPKCRCGCLFEDHGRLYCLNCGAAVSKIRAEHTRHVHSHKTYIGSKDGKPKTVPPYTARPTQRVPTGKTKAKAPIGCFIVILVWVAMFLLSFLSILFG